MGLKVTTDNNSVMVFRKDFEGSDGKKYPRYSLGISSKTKDGKWIKSYMPARFKGGADIPNMTKIFINESFFTNSEYKDQVTRSLMIMDYRIDEEGEKTDDFMDIPEGIEEELPFK